MTLSMRALGYLTVIVASLTSGASAAHADVCGCPSVGLFPGTPLTAVLHPTVRVDVADAAFDLSVTAYVRIGKTSLGRIGAFDARATATPMAVDLPVSSTLLKRARLIARQTGHARGIVEFVTTGPGLTQVTYESFVSLLAPVRTTATHVAVSGSLPAGQQARGSVLLRTPSWRRTSAPGVELATFNAVPAGSSCVADLVAQASIRASRFAVTLLDDIGPGSTNGTTRDAWRLQQGTEPVATVPTLSAVGAHRVARNRYAVLKLSVGFRPGCPPTAANTPALVAALRRAVSHITAKVSRH